MAWGGDHSIKCNWEVHGISPEWFTLGEAVAVYTWLPQMATHVVVFLDLHRMPRPLSLTEAGPSLVNPDAFNCR